MCPPHLKLFSENDLVSKATAAVALEVMAGPSLTLVIGLTQMPYHFLPWK